MSKPAGPWICCRTVRQPLSPPGLLSVLRLRWSVATAPLLRRRRQHRGSHRGAGRRPFPSLAQPRRSHRTMHIAPSHLSASAIHGSRLRGRHRTTGSRSRRVTVADWTPLRRSNPRETRHRARNARRRTQSAGGRPRTPDDLPNRSAPGRRGKPEELFQGQWQSRRTKLDDFKPYLHEQWAGAARMPGHSGRRSRATDTQVDTVPSGPTFVPFRTPRRRDGRRRPGPWPGRSSPTLTPCRRGND